MKHFLLSDRLRKGTNELGIELSEFQIDQFSQYYDLLSFWNKSVNLTNIIQEQEVAEKHFLDSICYFQAFPPGFLDLEFLDIGTGAGFPGVPLKITFPELKLSLMDPSYKRTSFLHNLNSVLGLNLRIIERKAELWLRDHNEFFDIMMMRAIGQIDHFIDAIYEKLRQNGRIIISTGPKAFNFANVANRRTELFPLTISSKSFQRNLLIIYKD